MARYSAAENSKWAGRNSGQELYLHEKVQKLSLEEALENNPQGAIGLLGYSCDEGVKRNLGRPGAIEGPDEIRQQLGKLPNHLDADKDLLDLGNVQCEDGVMETAQELLASKVSAMVSGNIFPLLLGGGHDIAYAHYRGLRNTLPKDTRLGIINLDAHLDLRAPDEQGNSGTPFTQIAQDAKKEGFAFHYLCMGVRKDANDASLFKRAQDLGVTIIPRETFTPEDKEAVKGQLEAFLKTVDKVYLTIDLDGFSSAYAPGVSAASPMGFCPDMGWTVLNTLLPTGKLMGADVAELNPRYDIDGQTARLAASLIHHLIHKISLR